MTDMARLVLVTLLVAIASVTALPAASESVSVEAPADARAADRSVRQEWVVGTLAEIIDGIEPISEEVRLRRSLAHATFCLPQNVLGILYYAFNQLFGSVLCTQEMNEMTVVVTGLPFGASLGRYIFVSVPLLNERAVRHEYGHAMQGYRHGPFYLLLEGTASFVEVLAAVIVPSLADSYFDRWPESEANELGGVQ